jgi:hypothetical protein
MLSLVLACTSGPPDEASVPNTRRALGNLPVWGGTLEVWGARAVLADPDGDRVLIVDTSRGQVTGVVQLEPDSAPFRITTDGETAWVTLRGSGELAEIELDTASLRRVDPICNEPRGLDFDPRSGDVYVSCADGFLVQHDESGDVHIPVVPGLREVLVTPQDLWVAPLHGATIYEINPYDPVRFEEYVLPLDVVWRLKASGDSYLALGSVHSPVAVDRTLESLEESGGGGGGGGGGFYGTAQADDRCAAVVQSAFATPEGLFELELPLAVDFAVSPGFAVVSAARSEEGARVQVFDQIVNCMPQQGPQLRNTEGHAVAVEFDSVGRAVVQLQQPLGLLIDGQPVALGVDTWTEPAHREAFSLFHEVTDVGLACASCHPEGQDDGHVWKFLVEDGHEIQRRTLPLAGALASRAPYHWQGDLPTLSDLMLDTFNAGMQGRPVPWAEQTALLDWLDGVRPTQISVPDVTYALGESVFFDPQVGCARCHSGPAFTDNQLWDVRPYDGEGPLKTPSLLGVGARSPLLHDGCALTLEDRFEGDLSCTSERDHGDTSSLTQRELEALVAYLRTL